MRRLQGDVYSINIEFLSVLPSPVFTDNAVFSSTDKRALAAANQFLVRRSEYQSFQILERNRYNLGGQVEYRIQFYPDR